MPVKPFHEFGIVVHTPKRAACLPLVHRTEAPTLGVELELPIIDRETGRLVPASRQLLRASAEESLPGIDAEVMQSMIEVKTGVCGDVVQVRHELLSRLRRLNEMAEGLGCGLALSGTHPFSRAERGWVFPAERYRRFARKAAGFVAQSQVFGLHVHVGVGSGDRVIGIMNLLVPYLPHLIALSANSPCWHGADTGMASSRLALGSHLPTAGMPPALNSWAEFLSFEQYMRAGRAIESLKDIHWDIRPRPDLGTIEIRICDAPPTLAAVWGLAALVRSLIVWLSRGLDENPAVGRHFRPRHWLAIENRWLAIRYGLAAECVELNGDRRPLRQRIAELLERLEPVAHETGDAPFLAALEPVGGFECGSERQRRLRAESGGWGEVVRQLANDLAGELDVCRPTPSGHLSQQDRPARSEPLNVKDIRNFSFLAT